MRLQNDNICKPIDYEEWTWVKRTCKDLGYEVYMSDEDSYRRYPYIVYSNEYGNEEIQGHGTGITLYKGHSDILSVEEFLKRAGHHVMKPMTVCQVHQLV